MLQRGRSASGTLTSERKKGRAGVTMACPKMSAATAAMAGPYGEEWEMRLHIDRHPGPRGPVGGNGSMSGGCTEEERVTLGRRKRLATCNRSVQYGYCQTGC